MRVTRSVKNAVMAAVVAIGLSSTVSADTVDFIRITNNGSQDVASQLSVEVSDLGSNQVGFKFMNSGPLASSIADIYVQDGVSGNGPLAGWASPAFQASSGVSFGIGAAPPNLPGGNGISFVASFSADSNAPTAPNGINPGEWLLAKFTLESGKSFQHVLDALTGPFGAGKLRFGLHVQALPDGESDSFVSVPGDPGTPGEPVVVPLPASVWAGLGLLAGLGTMRVVRRRRMAEGL